MGADVTLVAHMARKWDSKGEASLRAAQAAFRQYRGEDGYAEREAAIAALPVAEWKGRQLRAFRCHGETGKGPHDVNVPESLLWVLIGLDRWKCPYHA